MSELCEPKERPRMAWRWAVWLLFVAVWSTALLVPDPIDILLRHTEGVVELSHRTTFLMAKSLHVAAYALAAVLTGWLHTSTRWRWGLLAFWSLHACATEYGQTFVPGRTGSVRDVIIDHIGLAIGLSLSWRWWRR
jgi:VanZ family protein